MECVASSSYLEGMVYGGIGVTLIIFGIIGWPATRYVLGVVSHPFTKRPPRRPIGSQFWDKYQDPNWAKREKKRLARKK